jgi:hypothetical protein
MNLEKLIIVKSQDGRTNIQSIKALRQKDEERPPQEPRPQASLPPIHIDLLTYKISKVIVKDYSGGGDPVIEEYSLNIDERLENIQDIDALVRVVALKTLTRLPNMVLQDFNLASLKGHLNGMLEGVVGQAPGLKGTVDQSLDTAADLLKKTGEGVSGVLHKLPFGNRE